jgi:Protein of unknown function (DUF3465)
MKKFLMLIVILAGLATAGYRFLPVDTQQKVNAEIAQLKGALPDAAESTAPKKYVLEIPDESSSLRAKGSAAKSSESEVANAYMLHSQDIQVMGEGEVVKVLADDNQGSKHQRFILRMPEGFTVLVAHNIDLAPRVKNIVQGDKVSFYGEYVWNEKGGVVHWTHGDPRGRHVSGWLKHNGVTYQ